MREFRISLESRKWNGLAISVRIFASKRSMVAAVRRQMNRRIVANFMAFTCSGGSKMPRGVAGIIFLCNQHLKIGTVAHEAVHAASGLFRRLGEKEMKFTTGFAHPNEELFAQAVDVITDAIHKHGRPV